MCNRWMNGWLGKVRRKVRQRWIKGDKVWMIMITQENAQRDEVLEEEKPGTKWTHQSRP